MQFKQLQINPKKMSALQRDSKPIASALALQCSNQLSYKDPYIAFEAGKFVEFILTREWNEAMKMM